MRAANTLLALGVVLSAVGCQKVWGFEDFQQGTSSSGGGAAGSGGGGTGGGGTGGAGGNAGAATGGAAGAAPCANPNAPTGTVGVHVSDGSCVWVDKFEATRAEYAQMLGSSPTPPTGCEWDTSLNGPQEPFGAVPCVGPGETGDAGSDAGADPTLPVTCVDWCDAMTFCAVKGMKLCAGTYNSPKKGTWYDVCSDNGKNTYPYGVTHQANACNDSTNTVTNGQLQAPGTETQCVTADGVEDLSGNVSEWTDACSDGSQSAQCDYRGGSVGDDQTSTTCDSLKSLKRTQGTAQLGFRCCWLPP